MINWKVIIKKTLLLDAPSNYIKEETHSAGEEFAPWWTSQLPIWQVTGLTCSWRKLRSARWSLLFGNWLGNQKKTVWRWQGRRSQRETSNLYCILQSFKSWLEFGQLGSQNMESIEDQVFIYGTSANICNTYKWQ